MNRPGLAVVTPGRVPYEAAHAVQLGVREAMLRGELGRDVLLLLEHEPTVTLGRGTRTASLPLAVEELRRRGQTVVEVERGGDVTWHGPGQLVGYPVMDLTRHRQDLHWYLRELEAALIDGLAALGIGAGRNRGYTGVWTEGRKIASIGVHVRRWVTLHGFALNVTNDLSGFGLIVPCGIAGVEMTSVARERQPAHGREDPARLWAATLSAVTTAFAGRFNLHPEPASLEELAVLGTGTEPAAFPRR